MKRGRHSNPRATFRSVARKVPPPSSRRGLNSKKEDAARKDKLRARRTGFWKRLFGAVRALVVTVFLFAVLGACGWAAYQAYERNGFLALREVDVTGNHLLDKSALLEKAGIELGVKLPMVPVARMESALRALPGVADVKVRRIFPSRLEIQVSEQEPVAMGRAQAAGPNRPAAGKGWRGLAPDGTALPGLDLRGSDLPVIDGFASLGADARARIGSFLDAAKRGYPALYADFSQLSAHGDEIEIVLRDGRQKVILDMSNKSLSSLEFLQALRRQQGASLESGKTIDMRVEGFAYVR
jgi:hypothetical protein